MKHLVTSILLFLSISIFAQYHHAIGLQLTGQYYFDGRKFYFQNNMSRVRFTGQMYSDEFTINLNGNIAPRESKNEHKEQLLITPNPVNDVVEIKSNVHEIKSIEILDYQGKILVKNMNVNTINYRLNVSDWANGVYFTKVEFSNETSQITKFVVTH